jgi:hypothetical protein
MNWERDRDKGFESQFAHREEVAFKAAAHRNRLLAQWAAERMGLRSKAADDYVTSVVTGDVAHLRGRAIVQKIAADLAAAKVAVSEAEVAAAFDRFDAQSAAEHKND